MARSIAVGAARAFPAGTATRADASPFRGRHRRLARGERRRPVATTTKAHARPPIAEEAAGDGDDDDDSRLARELEAMVESTRAAGAGARMHVVAFSGGVDSSLVAHVVHRAFGAGDDEDDDDRSDASPRCVAAIGVSPSLPQSQLHIARDVAAHIGIPLWELRTNEGDVPEYVANDGESCAHCKNALYSTLRAVAAAAVNDVASDVAPSDVAPSDVAPSDVAPSDVAPSAEQRVVLYNGTNADDLKDPTRLGILAAAHHRVESPACHLDKTRVRRLAFAAGLPNWNLAAAPCLRSRLAPGVHATPSQLEAVEAAEAAVRAALDVGPTENMRVRVMSRAGDAALATLELDASRVEEVAIGGDAFDVVSAELGKRGMWLSDVRAFESGSVAKRLVFPDDDDDDAAGDDDDTAGDDGGGKVAWSSLFMRFAPAVVASSSSAPGPLERWDAEQCEIAMAGGDPFVVSFGTTWCGPCHVLEPELETLAEFTWEFDDSIAVAKLDAEASPAEEALAGRLGVDAYPTTVWMIGGREAHRVEGALPAAALVQLTASLVMDGEVAEVARATRPEMFAPVPLEPF